jgi:hypothetical protein
MEGLQIRTMNMSKPEKNDELGNLAVNMVSTWTTSLKIGMFFRAAQPNNFYKAHFMCFVFFSTAMG